MKRLLFASVVLLLAACGTPQQQCIGTVTRDLTVVDKLIVQTTGNLDRGYGYASTVITTPEFVDCTRDATEDHPHPRPVSCFEDVPQTVTRPVALDLNAEAAKLASLKAKRVQLAAAAAPAIADCRSRYPE